MKTINGNVDLSELALTELPKWLADCRVQGSFYCSRNNLTSLENAPCSVGESFYCDYNNLVTLKGAPRLVGGGFLCHHNNLTSLDGAPKKVEGDFDCMSNRKRFTEAEVMEVCEVHGEIFARFVDLEEDDEEW